MFTTHQPSNHNIVLNAYNEAIDKVAQLTGLSLQQSSSLLRQQLGSKTNVNKSYATSQREPILAEHEYQFITGLFH